ncbi:hypothetical protein P608_02230 [Comamonas thiooxydans]|uniref:Uncharacterized protein n=1 Tax=Comamonas thiooxydans TaxID=363952 RepID=A0A0E3CHX7_9BURK|nr:hypothetical protein P607_23745 [Comamonas thiooxydans]KGH17012.1 hypothetical protein P606_27070 [Comamonas thiooxydans]KGH21588.1 hypothetical protein P608_02230 [Comamonas thiooxydans]
MLAGLRGLHLVHAALQWCLHVADADRTKLHSACARQKKRQQRRRMQ